MLKKKKMSLCPLLFPQSWGRLWLLRISGRQLMLFTTRWAEELADGNRMAVKEKRALTDGALTPFCVSVFGGGRKERRELQDGRIGLQSSKVFILMPSLVTTYYLSSHMTEEKSSRKQREDKRKNSVNMYNYKFTTL